MKYPIKTKREGDCIVQSKAKRNDYSRVWINGDRWPSHRYSYHLNVQPVGRKPNNERTNLVLHKCDNKRCINPDHLYLGSSKDNAIDNAARNKEWRKRRSEVQSKIGFPQPSKEARERGNKKRSEIMKRKWQENREQMLANRGINESVDI